MTKPAPHKFTPFSDIEEHAEKLLLVDDDLRLALRCCAAVALSNTEEGTPPLWLMLVGAPSTGKTAAIEPFLDSPAVYELGKLTPNTLVSGMKPKKGEDGSEESPSLLHRIGTRKTLVFTDFSMLLGKNRDQREEIMSQLRIIYDGGATGDWGNNGTHFSWKGKLGFLAACTEVITEFTSVTASLGERFLYLRMRQSDPLAAAEKAIMMTAAEGPIKAGLKKVGAQFVETRRVLMKEVSIPHKIGKAILHLAMLVATLRTGIQRTENKFDERIMSYDPDGPTRVGKQLRQLARALAATRGADEVGFKDLKDTTRVALDSVPQDRRAMLAMLLKATKPMGVAELAVQSGKYTWVGAKRALVDLEVLKLTEKIGNNGGVVGAYEMVDPSALLRWRVANKVSALIGSELEKLL